MADGKAGTVDPGDIIEIDDDGSAWPFKDGAQAIQPADRPAHAFDMVDNYGIMRAAQGKPGIVPGSTTGDRIHFTNHNDAKVLTDISLGQGHDILMLEPRSAIVGDADGGDGVDLLVLAAPTGSRGDFTAATVTGAIRNFETMVKTGLGEWTVPEGLGSAGHWSPPNVVVMQGRLHLEGDNSAYAGLVRVGHEGILKAQGQSLPPRVYSHGMVHVEQRHDGIYAGTIGGPGLVSKTGAGTLTLTGTNHYTGDTNVAAGTLRAGTTRALSPASAFIVGPRATLDLNGHDHAIAGLTHAGTVRLGKAPGAALRVQGNYRGRNGTIHLNTRLGDDASASDKLVIAGGTATGHTWLHVHNAGGPGAPTTGNGIPVIQAVDGATTASDAFRLKTPVIAGPYEYTLYRGGLAGTARDSWFLRSDLHYGPQAMHDARQDPAQPSMPWGDPTPQAAAVQETAVLPPLTAAAAPPPRQNYRPETSLYAAVPALTLDYGTLLLDSFDQRTGGHSASRQDDAAADNNQRRAWGRFIRQNGWRAGANRGNGQPSYDYDFHATQLGIDVYRKHHHDGSRDSAGAYIAFGQGSADVTHVTRAAAGTDKFDASTVGAYWTHIAPGGWYIDSVLQGTWYNAKASGRLPHPMKTQGLGLGASLETGHPFALGNGFVIEPQAQLAYQAIDLQDGSDPGARIHYAEVQSLRARLAMRLARSWDWGSSTASPARQATGWVRLGLTDEWLGMPKTEFSSAHGSVPFGSDMRGPGFMVDAGLDAHAARNVALYGSLNLSRQFAGKAHNVGGIVGVKVAF